jgi:hypothetical protein
MRSDINQFGRLDKISDTTMFTEEDRKEAVKN